MAGRASNVFQGVRREIKAKQYDELGNEVEFDVREDEEQVRFPRPVALTKRDGFI
jgi:hypothetical protein